MSLFGALYEVHTAGGYAPWFGSRHSRLPPARARADEIGGYVIDLEQSEHAIGEVVVYMSPKYQRRHPMGGGSGAAGPTERVDPPASMWSSPPAWVTPGEAE